MQTKISRWIVLFLFIALFLFSYANQFIFRYEVPPGGDAFGHLRIVKTILNSDYLQIIQYHTIWHLCVVAFTLIFHVRSITVMAWLGPLLLVTMGMSLYYFNKRSFGTIAGVSSLILIGFLANQPLQTLYDGGFPNVLAAGTVLPLVFLTLMNVFDASPKKKLIAIPLFLLSLAVLRYSHHITTIYALATISLFLFIEFLKFGYLKKINPLVIIVCTIALFYVGVFLFLNTPIGGSAKGLAAQFIVLNFQFPFIHFIGQLNDPNAIWVLYDYPNGIGEAVTILGIGGFLLALGQLFIPHSTIKKRALVLLMLWTYVLFISSRMPSVGFPVRLARDLAIPLALLGGYFIHTIVRFIVDRKVAPYLFVPLFIIVCSALGSVTAQSRWDRAVSPNPLVNHLAVDSQAAAYITGQIASTAKIAQFQDDIYINEFTPSHTITLFYDIPNKFKKLTDVRTAESALLDIDYLYLERRYDRPEGWLNNDGLIETYSAAPFTMLIKKFEQPEKAVYLFKIIHRNPVLTTKKQ
jgi:hypothetical protein